MGNRRSTHLIRCFLDSSVLFSAVKSATGGSARLFALSGVELVISETVADEVQRNVEKKLYPYQLERYYFLMSRISIVKNLPGLSDFSAAQKVIVEKDALVLAEAKRAQTDYLLTLDKKHFFTREVIDFIKPQHVTNPQGFYLQNPQLNLVLSRPVDSG